MTAPTESEQLTYTVEEAARALGIGRGLAYRMAREGRLPGTLRLGDRIVISRAALRGALEQGWTHSV